MQIGDECRVGVARREVAQHRAACEAFLRHGGAFGDARAGAAAGLDEPGLRQQTVRGHDGVAIDPSSSARVRTGGSAEPGASSPRSILCRTLSAISVAVAPAMRSTEEASGTAFTVISVCDRTCYVLA
jgi:hypothetical protein